MQASAGPTKRHERAAPAAFQDPLLNRGTAFGADERTSLGLDGLLPPRVETLTEQADRVMEAIHEMASPIEKFRYLSEIHDENETLFYRVLIDHLEELLPIVYTPTVGDACLKWSRIYARPRGLYLSAARHRGRIADVLRNWPRSDVGIIVVTDGGRILGLGDLGVNGMGIPIGKLALYTACAGVPPERCLPITLDVGTDTETIREDPYYLGQRTARLTGPAYDELIDELVGAVHDVFPDAVLQFEDFNNANAFRLLRRYRDRLCCFNDDIEGTGAMGLAGLYAAGRIIHRTLVDQRVLFVGAGEAALGIGKTVITAMQREGLSEGDARSRCLFMDSRGLVVASRSDLAEHKRPYAQDRPHVTELLAAVESFMPTALVGACGQGGMFTRPVLEAMARLNGRPVVFALSNPTSASECTAEQAYQWTGGRAIFASGSPFPPVAIGGNTLVSGQGNNSFIFPGVGLGLLVSGATRVVDEMFSAAAHALELQVSDSDLTSGRVFPAPKRMRAVAAAVATAVAETAYERGLAARPREGDVAQQVAAFMYEPKYG